MYARMKAENRLLDAPIGTNAMPLNFRTEMEYGTLIEGYKRVLATLYDPTLENYYKRCLTLFRHWKPAPHLRKPRSKDEIFGALMGVRRCLSAKQIPAYSKFIAKVSKDYPRMLPDAIYLAAMGHHFERIGRQQIAIHDFLSFLRGELETFRAAAPGPASEAEEFASRRQAVVRARPEALRVHTRRVSLPGRRPVRCAGVLPARGGHRHGQGRTRPPRWRDWPRVRGGRMDEGPAVSGRACRR